MAVRKSRTGTVDHTALRFNQASIIVLLLLAFLFNWAWMALFVGVVMAIGTIWPRAGLFKLIYARGIKPLGLLKADPHIDKPHPHLFAQGLGAIFLLMAALLFAAGASIVGWILTAIVIVLAAINLFAGFCMGCFIYYQLARRGVDLSLATWRSAE
jgi:hypothetical protein